MANPAPVRLLILDESKNRAEELIVLLRNSGRATRAQAVDSHEGLQSLLKSQSWDLFLSRPKANDVTAEQAIGLIKEFEKDIPFILLAEGDDAATITEGLKLGASDVALEGDDERLTMIIIRELSNLDVRRQMRRAEIELKDAKRRYDLLLDSSSAAIAYIQDGMHIFANSTYGELFGYDDFEDLEIVPIIDLISSADQDDFKKFLKSYADEDDPSREYTCVTNNESKLKAKMTLSQAQYEGEPCIQVMFRPHTEDANLAIQLAAISNQDLLTGLPNRQSFSEKLDQAINRAVQSESPSILFYIAVDGFSQIIAEAGISGSDLVLTSVAQHLSTLASEEQFLARFSDDVFVLLYPNGSKDEALEFAEQIRSSIAHHLCEVDKKTYNVTASIGLTLIGENASNQSEIISRCHRSSLEVPEGDHVAFFQQKLTVVPGTAGNNEDHLRKLLASAFDNSRFKLLFQPIISLHSEEDEQFEVLIRLIDDDGNEVLPGQFLDLAMREGYSEKLDRWIILQSIKHLAAHRGEGFQTRLFINVTAATMQDESFLAWIGVALKAARLPTDAIIIQFHESDAFTYLKQASQFTKKLRAMHCKASINHFGCSLNPMNSLQHLTVDYAKLDGSFAQSVDTSDEKRQELVMIIKSLQSKGILTAISGVESPTVLSTLWEAGVNFIQGNYLSEPLESMDYDFAAEDM